MRIGRFQAQKPAPYRKAPEEPAAFDTRANLTGLFSPDLAGAFDVSFDIDTEFHAKLAQYASSPISSFRPLAFIAAR